VAAPSAIPGTSGPPFSPARIWFQNEQGIAGPAGATLPQVEGFCIAFDDAWNEPDPTWTRIDDPGGALYVQHWVIDRGRQFELDKTATGTARITIRDLQGLLDPTNTDSPFFNQINPRKQAALALQNPVTGEWTTLFRGFVDNLKPTVDVSELYEDYDIELVDGFDILAATEVIPDVAGNTVPEESVGDVFYSEQNVDDRIRAALADANWPAALTNVFSGNVSVRGTVYSPRS
jgi:hypothetical protein